MIPLMFIDSATSAITLAIPMGLMSGLGTAAYYDLTMRSCPAGLHGTLMMLVTGVWMFALRGGDLLGSADLRQQPSTWIPLLRDCDDRCVHSDPPNTFFYPA